MSDPYRDAGGRPCPRCREVLAPDEDAPGELVCMSGCGRWMPDAAVAPLFPTEWIVERAEGNPFHVNPLPWAACVQCGRTTTPVYAGFVTTLALNRCAGHGTWIDDPVREHFLAAYAKCIDQVEEAKALAAKQSQFVDDLAASSPTAYLKLLDRIAALEARVAKLERS